MVILLSSAPGSRYYHMIDESVSEDYHRVTVSKRGAANPCSYHKAGGADGCSWLVDGLTHGLI